jgi:hypothetical protein
MAARTKDWKLRNPEKWLAQRQKQRREDPNYIKRSLAFLKKRRAEEHEEIRSLGDFYVRRKLSRGTLVHWSAWPDALVELKRAELKLNRQLRKSNGNT